VEPADIPDLPELPAVLSRPLGAVVPATRLAAAASPVRGDWRQASPQRDAGVLAGGYDQSELMSRADGILEVRRTFGKKGEITQVWRVEHEWVVQDKDLLLGDDEKLRPPASSLRGVAIREAGMVSEAARDTFPVRLRCERISERRTRLGEKPRRVAGEGRSVR